MTVCSEKPKKERKSDSAFFCLLSGLDQQTCHLINHIWLIRPAKDTAQKAGPRYSYDMKVLLKYQTIIFTLLVKCVNYLWRRWSAIALN